MMMGSTLARWCTVFLFRSTLPGIAEASSLLLVFLVCSAFCFETAASLTALPTTTTTTPSKFVILDGTGKIGTAVAAHLSHRLSTSSSSSTASSSACEIVLVGRRPSSAKNDEYFQGALREIEELLVLSSSSSKENSNKHSSSMRPKISYRCVPDIWERGALDEVLSEGVGSSSSNNGVLPVSCLIHVAGPYAERSPTVLDACIDFRIPVYVDVSDPVDFLETSLELHDRAVAAGTTAVLAAGAFPGMSNVLAMEAAGVCSESSSSVAVKDVRFNYFTKGLGGSGTVNLYITNLGFGDPMVMHEKGRRTRFDDLSGRLLGKVDFFIPNDNMGDDDTNGSWKKDNARAKARVGSQKVFAWPFPEAATVASELSIKGSSSSAMGTAPDLWNDMLGLLVDLVPRNWWRSQKFSKFLADFSEPLVLATDLAMRKLSSSSNKETGEGDCGETHAMRVDVVTEAKVEGTDTVTQSMISIVQCHDSFRRCVGQSCAEFALDALLEHERAAKTGVYLPEQRYRESTDRARIVEKLTSTPGTFCYTGPVQIRPDIVEKDEIEAPVDRILLKSTPTPGLICNGAPIEVRLERIEEEDEQEPSSADNEGELKQRRPKQLPVYPTDVREIVRAMENQSQ